ncbi:hypothetical protein B0H14DRAFT_3441931 [Mycena olivaceomarginata]|nr:hypothetical protein B0H14DRAFT_3441931 [Mycena olivaceomarginata]
MASSPIAVSEIVWDRVLYIVMISDEGNPPFFGSETRGPDLVPIFSCTSQLVRLISDSGDLPEMCDVFETLANTAGATLTEMSGFRVKPNKPNDPTPFMHFTVLRSLKWNPLITFSKGTPRQFSAALPALESLVESS